jgi:hypothetical protein
MSSRLANEVESTRWTTACRLDADGAFLDLSLTHKFRLAQVHSRDIGLEQHGPVQPMCRYRQMSLVRTTLLTNKQNC